MLGRLKFDDDVLEWVRDALHASDADERRELEEAIRRHQTEFKRLQDRINPMYVDKLDGLIETAFFERMSNQWCEEQNRCQREIERRQNADKSYKDEGIALLDLARNAQRLFAAQEPREKRRLLNFLLSNCTWEDGEAVSTFREPFDMLAETAADSNRLESGVTLKTAKTEIWLACLSRGTETVDVDPAVLYRIGGVGDLNDLAGGFYRDRSTVGRRRISYVILIHSASTNSLAAGRASIRTSDSGAVTLHVPSRRATANLSARS
jgi:hypothetical protein